MKETMNINDEDSIATVQYMPSMEPYCDEGGNNLISMKFDSNRESLILSKKSKLSKIIWKYMKISNVNLQHGQSRVNNKFNCGDLVYDTCNEIGNAIVLKETAEYIWVVLEKVHFNVREKESKFKKIRRHCDGIKSIYRFALYIDDFITYEDMEELMK